MGPGARCLATAVKSHASAAARFVGHHHPCDAAFLANPPFNISDWGGERLRDDKRWQYGVPPAGNANFAWVQHIAYHLAPAGVAGFVLANGSMSSNQSGEGEYADVAGFCKSAPLEEVRKHGHVLTPGRYVGAEAQEDDGEILEIRGERVMLDADLADVYGVTTKALNQAIKRNLDRFPEDFKFQLTAGELDSLRSQTVTSKQVAIPVYRRRCPDACPLGCTDARPLPGTPVAEDQTWDARREGKR